MEAKEKLQLRLLRMMSNSLSDEQLKTLKDSISKNNNIIFAIKHLSENTRVLF